MQNGGSPGIARVENAQIETFRVAATGDGRVRQKLTENTRIYYFTARVKRDGFQDSGPISENATFQDLEATTTMAFAATELRGDRSSRQNVSGTAIDILRRPAYIVSHLLNLESASPSPEQL
jgi:hypothetical protein